MEPSSNENTESGNISEVGIDPRTRLIQEKKWMSHGNDSLFELWEFQRESWRGGRGGETLGVVVDVHHEPCTVGDTDRSKDTSVPVGRFLP